MKVLKLSIFVAAAVAAGSMAGLALAQGGVPGGGGGSAGGGGGGGGGMQIMTQQGMFLVDLAQPGEAAVGGFVLAALAGTLATPADTVVTINGVRLVHATGLAAAWFTVDPNGPQPAIAADNIMHIVASSVSANQKKQLDLQCPARVIVATSPAVGHSLTGAATLDMAWTVLPQNVTLATAGNFVPPPTAGLFPYDLASGTISGAGELNFLNQTSTVTSLPVMPTASGYMAELRFPGIYHFDGNSGGFCGRAQRYAYLQ